MLSAHDALRAGRLGQAIEALGVELRGDPADVRRRTFLFELLCFAGQYDRADKQLDVLAGAGAEASMGALLYRAALHAERTRADAFRAGRPPAGGPARPVAGTLNGRPFTSLVDADPRVGARLELYAAGSYVWLPFEHVASVRLEAPRRLRDLLWAPAVVRTGPAFRGRELGEVLLPALAPLTAEHPDDQVRLGRVTDWQPIDGSGDAHAGDDGPREAPVGQKLWLVDGEEFPLLEVRELVVTPPLPLPDPAAA
jgi:type VI secretion system protein ImpE